MIRVIINADDLGYSISVNEAINDCLKLGCITSSTIMANAPAFEDGVRIAKEHSEASFGVHLNIIEFKPITEDSIFKKYGLVDENGFFREGAAFVIKEYPKELINAVYKEWDAQIKRVKAAGIVPSHLDSHQHTHTIDALKEVVLRLMKEHDINNIRRKHIPSIRLMINSRNHSSVQLDKSNAVLPKKRNVLVRRLLLIGSIFNSIKWCRYFSHHSNITDDFYPYRTTIYNSKLLLKKLQGKTIELMCHPGHPAFEEETRMVRSFEFSNIYNSKLINYKDL